jgi:hypothetical protein
MSLFSWNCRGFGSPSAIPNLKYHIRYYNPTILFLSETLVYHNKVEEFRYVLSFDSCFVVDRIGRGGDLALYWHSSTNCQIVDYSNKHITIEILDDEKGI